MLWSTAREYEKPIIAELDQQEGCEVDHTFDIAKYSGFQITIYHQGWAKCIPIFLLK